MGWSNRISVLTLKCFLLFTKTQIIGSLLCSHHRNPQNSPTKINLEDLELETAEIKMPAQVVRSNVSRRTATGTSSSRIAGSWRRTSNYCLPSIPFCNMNGPIRGSSTTTPTNMLKENDIGNNPEQLHEDSQKTKRVNCRLQSLNFFCMVEVK